jgi:DNA topoisomerase I
VNGWRRRGQRQGYRRCGEDAVLGVQHFTQPPPRYTEATLVKKMEEIGIGRPSTYASIVTTIQDRGYVRKEANRLIPEDKGRLVTIFLLNYFRRYVGYDFTAEMEAQLDHISAGEADYKEVLERFWRDFSAALEETSELRISEVLEKIDEVLAPHLYPPREDGGDARLCPACNAGRLNLRTSRAGGAFIGCSNYPECRYTRPISGPNEDDGALGPDGKLLGHDAEGAPITLRSGRFGPYVQRGEASESVPKPPRASLPKGWSVEEMDLEKAHMLLSLPREIGPHPEDGAPVEAGIGRYGPYVRHGRIYANLPEADEVFTIGMNRAVEVLAQKASRGRSAAAPLRELGEHPGKGGPVVVMNGRYGPYVKWDRINATLPKELTPEAITLDEAVALVDQKAAKGGKGTGARRASAGKKSAAAGKSGARTKTAAKTKAAGKSKSASRAGAASAGKEETQPQKTRATGKRAAGG